MSPRAGLSSGDTVLSMILLADFFTALAGATVHLTMVWWVLSQGVSSEIVSLLVLCIFMPLNLGVLLTGVAVARFGSRRLLIWSKLIATVGATVCCVLLATDLMTLPILAAVAIVTYGAMAPSVAADISRAPALTRLAGRRLASFHALNRISLVLGQISGLWLASALSTNFGSAFAVAVGLVLILISTAITWLGFPRDRLRRRSPLSTLAQVASLSKAVLNKLDGPRINRTAVLITAAIVSTAQACVEVVMPLAIRAAGLSSSALSTGLVLAIVCGVAASVVAQAAYDKVKLSHALLGISILLLMLLVWANTWQSVAGFYLAVGATAAAAAGSGTLTITALQINMPVSLQAQAIGLWECLILTIGSAAILITGFIDGWALMFLTGIAAVSAIGAALSVLSPPVPSQNRPQ